MFECESSSSDGIKNITLTLKKVVIKTPLGELGLTARELEGKLPLLPFDAYVNHDDYLGKILFWHLPTFTEEGCKNLRFAIQNIHRYEELRTEYKKLINEDPVVQWHLIFILICGSGIKKEFFPLENLPDWSTPQLLSNKKLFQSLANDGAKYKHYLVNGYGGIDPEDFKYYLKLFGRKAIIPIREELDLLSDHLISQRSPDTFKIIQQLLSAGVNINVRMGDKFNNTILHYLIALEDYQYAIKLINFVEKMQTIQPIDYSLQDSQGKTVLFLAVGLGLESLVDLLLKLHDEDQRYIGINIPDQLGRTPLMIAAALGYASICKKLIEHGANCFAKDNKQQDLHWYKSAPIEEVKNILQFLSINPDRGYYCSHSYLSSTANGTIPWVLVDENNKEHLLILSAKAEHMRCLIFVFESTHGEEKKYIAEQLQPLTKQFGSNYNKSIADKCKEHQSDVLYIYLRSIYYN